MHSEPKCQLRRERKRRAEDTKKTKKHRDGALIHDIKVRCDIIRECSVVRSVNPLKGIPFHLPP